MSGIPKYSVVVTSSGSFNQTYGPLTIDLAEVLVIELAKLLYNITGLQVTVKQTI